MMAMAIADISNHTITSVKYTQLIVNIKGKPVEKTGEKKAAYLNHKQASHYKCSSLCSINPFIRC